MLSKQIPLGIYEKALPAGECWLERLQLAKTLGFDFVEMSVVPFCSSSFPAGQ